MRGYIRACANTALVVASVIIATLSCEIGLRIIGFTNPGDFKIPNRGMAPRFYYVNEPTLGHDIVQNFPPDVFLLPDYTRTYGAPFPVASNSLGCRDRPFEPKDSYILLIGDSYTWGYAALEDTWGAILEHLIGQRVLKCGVPGYGPRQERQKLETVVERAGRPGVVIVGYSMNDLLDDYLYPSRTVIEGYLVDKVVLANALQGGREVRSEEALHARMIRSLESKSSVVGRVKDLLARYSILYDLLGTAEVLLPVTRRIGISQRQDPLSDVQPFRSATDFPWLAQAWEDHLNHLRQLKVVVESLGANMLVVVFPNTRQIYSSLRPQNGTFQWEYPNQRLTEFFEREQITFVDLLSEFRRYARCYGRSTPTTPEDLYWAHDDHPNVKGNRLAGLLIGRHVLEQSLVQVTDRSGRLSDIDQLLSAEDRCRTTTS